MKTKKMTMKTALLALALASLTLMISACGGGASSSDGFEASSSSSSSSSGAPSSGEQSLTGCIDPYASNYNTEARFSDNSCSYQALSCSSVDHVVEPNTITVDNSSLNLPLGSVIGIRGGSRNVLDIRNFQGTAQQPYLFSNCDAQVVLDISEKPEAIKVRNSSHLRVSGTGAPEHYFGIKIETGTQGIRAYSKTDNIEIDHLEVSGVGIGVWIVTRPNCEGSLNRGTYHQQNLVVHHNYIHDVHGEGMYIGGSKWNGYFSNDGCPGEELYQAELSGVRVFNNLVVNAGWDGIQVGGAEDSEIFSNQVKNYGLEQVSIHSAGMMVNPGTTGKIFANYIENGFGAGIQAIGFDTAIYSNYIVDCQANSIHVGDRSPLPGQSFSILNNTIVNSAGKALHFNSQESVNNVFSNNFLVSTQDATEIYNVTDNIDITNNISTTSLENFPAAGTSTIGLPRNTLTITDLSPASGSSLIDASVENALVDVDLFLRPRDAGAAMDIGAFEGQSNY